MFLHTYVLVVSGILDVPIEGFPGDMNTGELATSALKEKDTKVG